MGGEVRAAARARDGSHRRARRSLSPCNPYCYAYTPGWYPIAEVIAILRTLPGNYAGNIAELERKAADQEGRRAA